jgi:5-methylcytosine-specific restriction endonuclease McrA
MGLELLGGRCRVCGSTERLQFDHIDPSTKRTSRFWALRMCRIIDEIVKLQLLCWRCHRDKTLDEREGRTWPHGPSHDDGCMCGGCRLVDALRAYGVNI